MTDDRSKRLNQAIADFLQLDGADLSRIVDKHPDLADELHSFAQDYRSLRRAVSNDRPKEIASVLNQSAFKEQLAVTLDSGNPDNPSSPCVPDTRDVQYDATTSLPAGQRDLKSTVRKIDDSFQLPCAFGDYELLEQVAFGGMGVVYRARQQQLDRVVAVKMILAGKFASQQDVDRFHREARSAGSLEHPAIVPVYDVGTIEGQHYYSMGFVEGGSLSEKIADGPLPPRDAASLTRTIAEAVHFAHERGVIHRDLKPGNILIAPDGVPRITDFGLATREGEDQGMTVTGQIIGTPAWMPPEQATGRLSEVGPLSDVYSMGAILFALLTGRPPFMASAPLETLRQVVENDPVRPRALNPDVPLDLETICLKCLDKESTRRYSSAQSLAEDLKRFLNNEPIQARPVGRWERAGKWIRRHRLVSSLIATAAALLVLGTTVSTYFAIEADARATAEQTAREDLQLKEAEATQLASEKTQLSIEQQKAIEQLEANQYVARMREAQAALDSGDYDSAQKLLELYQPKEGLADRRCFVWHLLRRQLSKTSPETLVVTKNQDVNNVGGRLKTSPSGSRFAVSALHNMVIGDFQGEVDSRPSRSLSNISDLAFTFDDQFLFAACGRSRYRGRARNTQCLFEGIQMFSVKRPEKPLWRIEDAEESDTSEAGVCVACSPTQPILACGMAGGKIALWNYETRERLAVMSAPDVTKEGNSASAGTTDEGAAIEYRRLTFSPDGRKLASARFAHAIDLWDVEERKHSRVLYEYAARIPYRLETFETAFWLLDCGDLVFSDDGNYLAAAANGLDFLVFDLPNSSETRFSGHRDAVTSLAFVPGQDTIVSGSLDKSLRMWSIKSGTEITKLGSHPLPVFGVAVRPENRQVVSYGSDQQMRVWHLSNPDMHPHMLNNRTHIYSIRFLPDGRRLMVGGWNYRQDSTTNCSGVFDTETGARQMMLRNHSGRALSVDSSNDGNVLVSANLEEGAINVWNSRCEFVGSIPAGHEVTRVSLRPDGKLVAASAANPTQAGVFDVDTGELVASIPGHSVFSPDGRLLVTSYQGRLTLRDARSFEVLKPDFAAFAHNPRFSPDGRRIAFRTSNTAVSVFDLEEDRFIFSGDKHYSTVYDYAFAPDHRTLVTVSRDQRVLLWDLPTGELKARLTGHGGDVRSVDISHDGVLLATGSIDGTVRLWRNADTQWAPQLFDRTAARQSIPNITALEYDRSESIDLSKQSVLNRVGGGDLGTGIEITAAGLAMRGNSERKHRQVDIPLDRFGDFDVTISYEQLRLSKPGNYENFASFGVHFGGKDQESCTIHLKRSPKSGSVEAVSVRRWKVGSQPETKLIGQSVADSPLAQDVKIVRRGKQIYYFHRAGGREEFDLIRSHRIANEDSSPNRVSFGTFAKSVSPHIVWKNLELRWDDEDEPVPPKAPFDLDSLDYAFTNEVDLSSKQNLLSRAVSGVERDTFKYVDEGLQIQRQGRGAEDFWLPVFLDGDFDVSVVVDSFDFRSPGQNQSLFRCGVQFDQSGDNTFSLSVRRRVFDSKLVINTKVNSRTLTEVPQCEPGIRFYFVRRGDRLHFLCRGPDAAQTTRYLGSTLAPPNAGSRIWLGVYSTAEQSPTVVWRDLKIRSNSSISEVLENLESRRGQCKEEIFDLSDADSVARNFEFKQPDVVATGQGIRTSIPAGEGPSRSEAQIQRSLSGDFDIVAEVECAFPDWGRNQAFLEIDFAKNQGNCSVSVIRYFKGLSRSQSDCNREMPDGQKLNTNHGNTAAFQSKGQFRLVRVGEYIHVFLTRENADEFRYLVSHHVGTTKRVSGIRIGIDHNKDRESHAVWKRLAIRSWDQALSSEALKRSELNPGNRTQAQ